MENPISSKTEMDKRLREVLKQRFQLLLDEAGLSQVQAAEKLCLEKNHFWKITSGYIIPPARLKVKIAQLLKTDSCLIWRGKEYLESEDT